MASLALPEDQRFGLRARSCCPGHSRSTAARTSRRSRLRTRPMAACGGRLQRHPDLPRADRRPACRVGAPDHRQARLVDAHGGRGQADRSGAPLHHLRQRAGIVHGIVRPRLDRSRDRRALRHGVSRHHDPRHGARAGPAARSSRRRTLAAAIGGSMGGMQVLEWSATFPTACARRGDRIARAPFGAEYRIPRSRAAGDHGRSATGATAIITGPTIRPPPGSPWRAWRRTSPICPKPG
jgi:hypothetical protein